MAGEVETDDLRCRELASGRLQRVHAGRCRIEQGRARDREDLPSQRDVAEGEHAAKALCAPTQPSSHAQRTRRHRREFRRPSAA